VRFGSKADTYDAKRRLRFNPESNSDVRYGPEVDMAELSPRPSVAIQGQKDTGVLRRPSDCPPGKDEDACSYEAGNQIAEPTTTERDTEHIE
jgi:hypothetical protein